MWPALRVGDDGAEDETDDAVRDHNEIRDAVQHESAPMGGGRR
jgi:hypothetical protein